MAASNAKKSGKTPPARAVFLFMALEVMVVLMFAPTITIQRFIAHQRALTSATLGMRSERNINHKATHWYRDTLIKTGWLRATMRWAQPSHQDPTIPTHIVTGRIAHHLQMRLIALWWFIYAALYRVAMITAWLPYFAPIFLAALYDGLVRRQITKWRFEFSSPMRHQYASRSAGFLILAGFLIPLLPMPISPLFIPVMAGAFAISLRVWVASIQKRV